MRWKLKGYLEEHGVTAHALALESKLSLNSVYPVVRGTAERISLATLDRMLSALDQLTGEHASLADVLERDEAAPPRVRNLLDLAGSFDDPDSPGDVAQHHDKYISKSQIEEHQERVDGK